MEARKIKEKPITFSSNMSGVIAVGRKTQFRSAVTGRLYACEENQGKYYYKKPRIRTGTYETNCRKVVISKGNDVVSCREYFIPVRDWLVEFSPYSVGDRLWLRERWQETCDEYGTPIVAYRAGGQQIIGKNEDGYSLLGSQDTEYETSDDWRPDSEMPRWAARSVIEIVGVRVERLQSILLSEAILEGIEPLSRKWNLWRHYQNPDFNNGNGCDPITSYKSLWDLDHQNTDYAWANNPLVFVYDFKVI